MISESSVHCACQYVCHLIFECIFILSADDDSQNVKKVKLYL